MHHIPKSFAAQDISLARWVSPENRLSADEARAEALCHRIEVSINQPAPHPLAVALAAVLACGRCGSWPGGRVMTATAIPWAPAQVATIEDFICAVTEHSGPLPVVWANGADPFHDGTDLHPDDRPEPWPDPSDMERAAINQRLAAWSVEITEKDEDEDMTDKTEKDDKIINLDAARDDAQRIQGGDGTRENPFRWRSADMLRQVLDELGVEVRRNIRAHVIEFLNTTKTDPKWEAASDGKTADLRETIAKRFWFKARTAPEGSRLRFTREAWTDYLNALGFHREVDPFLEWLATLPAWDGTPRIEFILSDLFGAPDDDLSRWASRAPLVGAVQRARFPGSKIDESPILVSTEQGLGKSTLASSLVPPEYKDDWFGDALDLSSSKKEQAEALAGCVVVEISELDGLRRAEIGAVKSFLARTNDGQHRSAYAIAREKKPRRCVIIGTSNDEQCLANDPSGNRRLVPIILQHGAHVEAAADKDRDQWWAEAMVTQREGDDGRLPRALIPQQRVRAELHRSRDEHLEDLVMGLPATPMTISEIHDQIDGRMKSTISDHRLGSALRVQGLTKRKVRDGVKTRWDWVPPADTCTGE